VSNAAEGMDMSIPSWAVSWFDEKLVLKKPERDD